jgi:serine/threonine protein kinase
VSAPLAILTAGHTQLEPAPVANVHSTIIKAKAMPNELQLSRIWKVGARIGQGGFGRVYEATSGGKTAVVKLVPKATGADRELLFVDLHGVRNVVPILDSGETPSHWALVMPRAEKSLREHLDQSAAPLTVTESVSILSDIATALVDLTGQVVHRDLKPENVLLLDGHWCLADFGISRYAEATTAPDTHKFAWTPPYAAPEQWRHERAASATDIYASGVIAFELLSGHRPFPGRDYRDQHLHSDPPHLRGIAPALASLIEECLYKAPEARPSARDLLARLEQVLQPPPSSGLARLQEVNRAEAERRGQAARHQSAARSESERRAALFEAATRGFTTIATDLMTTIQEAAPAAVPRSVRGGGWSLRLNNADLQLASPVSTPATRALSFTVIAHSSVGLSIPRDQYGYEGRSHSLWFCDAGEAGSYRWYETAFMISALIRRQSRQAPFRLDPGAESAKALGPGIAEYQLAWPFTALIVGDLAQFVDRWAEWLAGAADGRLQRPSTMPERCSGGSWRK